jgi:hypothetical protein
MLNEWSSSLYESRQNRYLKRVDVVTQCVSVYHKQYKALRENIVAERFGLISRYAAIESELLTLIQEDHSFFEYHTSYLDRALKRFDAQFDRAVFNAMNLFIFYNFHFSQMNVLKNTLSQFIRHCGTIRRRGLARVAAAADKLKDELETSCNGMIMSYTSGSAQGFFDDLIYRGEKWRNTLTDLQA